MFALVSLYVMTNGSALSWTSLFFLFCIIGLYELDF